MADGLDDRDFLNKEEIIDILEKNVELYRNEPNFIKYLVELAVYLVEYRYEGTRRAAGEGDVRKIEDRKSDSEMRAEGASIYALHSHFSRQSSGRRCRFCGALLQSLKKCPVCGLMNS